LWCAGGKQAHYSIKKHKFMENYSIERLGIPNLDFNGELIGQSAGPSPRVKIYRTQGRKYIGQFDASQKFSKAEPFDKPLEVVAWFRINWTITPEIEDAIESAAKSDETFRAAWNEHVD
jgi:hypothetical protein